MAGTISFSPADITGLTVPEMCVLVYCTKKRIENEQQKEAGRTFSG